MKSNHIKSHVGYFGSELDYQLTAIVRLSLTRYHRLVIEGKLDLDPMHSTEERVPATIDKDK